MAVIIDPPFIDPDTGMIVEIVRDADTKKVIGKNERMPEPEPEGVE